MRVVFAGTPQVSVVSLEALLASEHEVVAVVTRPDAVAGRGHRVTPSPVSAAARDHDIPVLAPAKPGEPEFIDQLTELAPDCCPVVAYGALIPQRVLDIPAKGWVNLHFSLLPAWRGAAPVQRAIMAGDDVTGAAVFQLEAGMDTGPVYGVVTEAIGPKDTSGDLLGRLAQSGAQLLVKVLDAVSTTDERLEPGRVRVDRNRVLVGTLTDAVALGTVQPAGKKAMAAADWARGLHGGDLVFE